MPVYCQRTENPLFAEILGNPGEIIAPRKPGYAIVIAAAENSERAAKCSACAHGSALYTGFRSFSLPLLNAAMRS
ncbi:MAG: hypothetical protein Pg6C_00250 [Treponemataceae bacterium]|nr:MAG: hypothetical protein Pg6C_00250 [Treponemataceae bacterium]